MADLPPAAFDVLWDDLRLGPQPFPLQVACHGDTLDERARIKAAVYAELDRRGLTRAGAPVPELVSGLRLLAAPDMTVDLVVLHNAESDARPRAVVATRGRHAVRAVQTARAIHLAEVRDTAVVASVLELLPACKPGPGRSITVPASAAQPQASGGYTESLTGQAAHRVALSHLSAVMQRPIQRAGTLGVTVRDAQGKPRRHPGLLWLDNDQGRYLLSTQHTTDGEDWTTLSPADTARFGARITEIVAALRQD
ncbi:ESX secretion-associated protein EspG [Actinokineospora sp. NBRC 105648]|nr:ESX secretion-associated protein EspG [Actinokineospora sp. NBRC 105648]